MSDLILNSALRNNLLAIAATDAAIARSSNRIATGLRVNGPQDDLVAYLQASQLRLDADRAREPLDEIARASGAINAALAGIEAISGILDQLQALLTSARTRQTYADYQTAVNDPDAATRFQTIADSYDRLIGQITNIVQDSGFDGINLIGDSDVDANNPYLYRPSDLSVSLNADGSSAFNFTGTYLGAQLLEIDTAAGPGGGVGVLDFVPTLDQVRREVSTGGGSLAFPAAGAGEGLTGIGPVIAAPAYLRLDTRASTPLPVDPTGGTGTTTISYSNIVFNADGTKSATLNFNAPTANPTVPIVIGAGINVTILNVGLGLLPAQVVDNLATTQGQTNAQISLDQARAELSAVAARLGFAQQFLEARAEFQEGIATEYEAGEAKLIELDLNAEGAKLTALTTLRSIGINATSNRLSAAAGVVTLLDGLLGQR